MKLQLPRFTGLALVAAICLGALNSEARTPERYREQQQQNDPQANAVKQHHHHELQAKKYAEDDSQHVPANNGDEENAAWNHKKKPKELCSPVILVCDGIVLEKILCPVDSLPPVIINGAMVEAESSQEFSANWKKPKCKVVGEPRYVTMPGTCYKKPPPFCPIILDDAPPAAASEDEDYDDEEDEVDNDDLDDEMDAETAYTEDREERSALLHERHSALRRRQNNQGYQLHHQENHPHCNKPHEKAKIPQYGGNNDTWAGLCVQTGFFCADRLFACGLDPKVLYSCDRFGYPPNINATCDHACVHGHIVGQDMCDGITPPPQLATSQELFVVKTTEPLQPNNPSEKKDEVPTSLGPSDAESEEDPRPAH